MSLFSDSDSAGLRAARTLTALFLVSLGSCALPWSKDSKPGDAIFELDRQSEPVKFRALQGKGGMTLAFCTRPPQHFLARPIYSAEQGQLLRLNVSETVLNLGYVPPRGLRAEIRFTVTVDWVVRGPGDYRQSGVTEVLLEVSPDETTRVVGARNILDSRAP
jgi:hypothetical protein